MDAPLLQQQNPGDTQTTGGHKILIIILLTLLIVAGVAYAFFIKSTSSVTSNDAPPSLTIAEESGLQGSFVDKKLKCLKFEDSDIKAFAEKEVGLKANNTPVAELKKNFNYLMTTEDISVEKIVSQIEASTAKCIILAYFGSGEKGLEKKFYTYPPENPFVGTVMIDDSKKSSFIIPKGRGVIIFSMGASKAYGLQQATVPAKVRAELISEDLEGWFLVGGATSDASEFKEYEARTVTSAVAEGYLTWLKLKKGKNVTAGNASTPEQAVQLTAEITSSLMPPILTIAAPDGSPTLAAPFPVKITGKNLTHLDTITFDDSNITAAFKPAVTDYEMNMDVTVQPETKEGVKTLTLTSKNGTKTTAEITVAYKKLEAQPKLVTISPDVVTLSGKSVTIQLAGENLESIDAVSFDDVNLKTSAYSTKKEINPFNLAEDAKIYGSFNILIDTNTVKEGIKKFKYTYKGVEKESALSLVVLKEVDPKAYAEKPYIQLVTPKTYEIGSGPLTLDLYGVNLQNVDTAKSILFHDPVTAFGKEISSNAVMTGSDMISNQHLQIHFKNLGSAIEVLPEKYRLDFEPTAAGGKYIDGAMQFIQFTSSAKAPKISTMSQTQFQSGTGEPIPFTIEGENFNTNTKLSYVLPTAFKDQEKATIEITSITDKKIDATIVIPGYGYGFYPELQVENGYGMAKKEILVKENENVKPVIEKITPATAEFNYKKPIVLTITGKRLDKMKNIWIDMPNGTKIQDAIIESTFPDVISVSLTPFYPIEPEKIPAKSEMTVTLSGLNGKVVKPGGLTLTSPKFAPKTITPQFEQLTYTPHVVLIINGENMNLAKSASIEMASPSSQLYIISKEISMTIIDTQTVQLEFDISKGTGMYAGEEIGKIKAKITFAENSTDIDGKTVDRITSPIQIVNGVD